MTIDFVSPEKPGSFETLPQRKIQVGPTSREIDIQMRDMDCPSDEKTRDVGGINEWAFDAGIICFGRMVPHFFGLKRQWHKS